eukprot:366330-Chlamydomonas_euryale.AAC.2
MCPSKPLPPSRVRSEHFAGQCPCFVSLLGDESSTDADVRHARELLAETTRQVTALEGVIRETLTDDIESSWAASRPARMKDAA